MAAVSMIRATSVPALSMDQSLNEAIETLRKRQASKTTLPGISRVNSAATPFSEPSPQHSSRRNTRRDNRDHVVGDVVREPARDVGVWEGDTFKPPSAKSPNSRRLTPLSTHDSAAGDTAQHARDAAALEGDAAKSAAKPAIVRRSYGRHLTLPAPDSAPDKLNGGVPNRSMTRSLTGPWRGSSKPLPALTPTKPRASTSVTPVRTPSKQRISLPPHNGHNKDFMLHSRSSSKVKTPEGRTAVDSSFDDKDDLDSPRAKPITVKRRLSNLAMRSSSKQHPHDIIELAHSLHMPWEDLKMAVHLFKQHSGHITAVDFQDIALTKEQFTKLICEMCHVDSLKEISPELLATTFRTADRDGNEKIDIEEFTLWFSSHSFSEEIVLDKASLEVRKLARKLDLSVVDVDRYKKTFDKYDVDGSGLIEYDEFDDLLQSLLKTTEDLRLPHERVQNLWRSADADGSGELDFEEFCAFYMRYFDDRWGHNDPVEGFYRGLRKVNTIQ